MPFKAFNKVHPNTDKHLTPLGKNKRSQAADAGWKPDNPVIPEKDRKDEGENIPILYKTTATMTMIRIAQP